MSHYLDTRVDSSPHPFHTHTRQLTLPMVTETKAANKQCAKSRPKGPSNTERTPKSETELLIPYVSDDDDSDTEDEDASFGHCWNCDAPLPPPTPSKFTVECIECQFPN
jgi:hypothetical protein